MLIIVGMIYLEKFIQNYRLCNKFRILIFWVTISWHNLWIIVLKTLYLKPWPIHLLHFYTLNWISNPLRNINNLHNCLQSRRKLIYRYLSKRDGLNNFYVELRSEENIRTAVPISINYRYFSKHKHFKRESSDDLSPRRQQQIKNSRWSMKFLMALISINNINWLSRIGSRNSFYWAIALRRWEQLQDYLWRGASKSINSLW